MQWKGHVFEKNRGLTNRGDVLIVGYSLWHGRLMSLGCAVRGHGGIGCDALAGVVRCVDFLSQGFPGSDKDGRR